MDQSELDKQLVRDLTDAAGQSCSSDVIIKERKVISLIANLRQQLASAAAGYPPCRQAPSYSAHFTPGPWFVFKPHGTQDYYIIRPNTCTIAIVYNTQDDAPADPCEGGNNADLMAASPTMYAALVETENFVRRADARQLWNGRSDITLDEAERQVDRHPGPLLTQIRGALKLARGGRTYED